MDALALSEGDQRIFDRGGYGPRLRCSAQRGGREARKRERAHRRVRWF